MFARNVLALAFLAITALAQIPGLPDCAQHCVTSFGNCKQVDVKCICSDKPLIAGLACCVSTSCDAQGQAAVISFADSLCSGQGVTDLPTSATCAPGASTGAATASGSSGSSTGTMTMTSGASSGTGSAAASTASEQSTSAASSSAAAATTSGSSAGKISYPVEGVGLGMAILGFLVGL